MKDAVLLVSVDLDDEVLGGTELRLVGEREKADLVEGIRGVGDELTKVDLSRRR